MNIKSVRAARLTFFFLTILTTVMIHQFSFKLLMGEKQNCQVTI